ncbi:MAG: DNA polymerase I [Candidatus Sumerlaea chitinivorans]|jgi:DNA polymerase-1|nr:DNA polymerase I [Candidatus Sumerlaea chitinivorans]
MGNPVLYIVDGHSQVFKAYHAIQQLSTSTGIPTNAVFGFCQILHALLRKHNPEYLAVAFDTGAPTFRHEAYAAYKANRPEPPADLPLQMGYIRRVLEGLRVPIFQRDGYEADDVIATLTRLALEKGFDVIIVSADKDLFQLVNDRVKILRLEPDKETLFDREAVREKMGVWPEQMLDFLAMVGDSSDNIPGIRGVGPKTAATLLNQFGTLENVLAHASEQKGKLRENLEAGREAVVLSRKLVALDDHVPLDVDWKALRRPEPDYEKLAEVYRELEFRQFLQEIQPAQQKHRAHTYRAIVQLADLQKFCEKIRRKGYVAIDTETDSLDTMRAQLVGISLAVEPHDAVYVPIAHTGPLGEPLTPQLTIDEVYSVLDPILRSEAVLKVGHNLKYDRKVLLRYGFAVEGPAFDTLIASYLLNPDKRVHGLKELAMDWLNWQMTPLQELIGSGREQISFAQVELEKAVAYAAADADATLQLWQLLSARLRESGMLELFERMEMPLMDVLIDMELTGVRIDGQHFARLADELGRQLQELRHRIVQLAGEDFNVGSPKQVAHILFEKLGLKPKRRGKTGFSTDVEVLEELADEHEIARLLLEYRQVEKLKNTYVDVLPTMIHPATGRVHTTYHQTTAATGRLSSSDPNLQNIPVRTPLGRKIRAGFIPSQPDYVLLSADYSQIELRILAHISKDPVLIEAFRQGRDIHALTAAKIFKVPLSAVTEQQRDQAKVVNFGIIYGMSPPGLSQRLKIPLEEAKGFIEEYYEAYQGVKQWIEETKERARKEGYVTTLGGRRRYLPDINSQNYAARSAAERIAINAPIQGSSADMIKLAMIAIHQWLRESDLYARLIMQVHDELIFDLPEQELEAVMPEVKRYMENAMPLDVPVQVDMKYGRTWAEC